MPPTDSERCSPTYAQAVRSVTRPSPINTKIAVPSVRGSVNSAATTSSIHGSTHPGSMASALTADTSQQNSSKWSPVPEATQSATLPKKMSWDGPSSAGRAGQGYMYPPNVATPLFGLGVQWEKHASVFDASPTAETKKDHRALPPKSPFDSSFFKRPSSPYQLKEQSIPEPQTSPYTRKISEMSNTFPLMQNEFGSSRVTADQHRLPSTPFKLGHSSTAIGGEKKPLLHKTPSIDRAGSTEDAHLEHTPANPTRPDSAMHATVESVLSDTDSDKSPIVKKEDVVDVILEQATHPKSFGRFLKSFATPAFLDSSFSSAFVSLKSLNGPPLSVKSNVTLICIKSESILNVQYSVQRNTWCVMDKVGERINRLWDRRENDEEKVYLLISVNGQKSYCGLAEMSGRWKLGGLHQRWDLSKGKPRSEFGLIPVTWRYVKNVSYAWFSHIRAPNDSAITNMWNGMQFPGNTGIDVLRIYIERPHFTNVICWERSGAYQPSNKGTLQAWQIDPDLSNHGMRKKGRLSGPPPRLNLDDGTEDNGDQDTGEQAQEQGNGHYVSDTATEVHSPKPLHHAGRNIAASASGSPGVSVGPRPQAILATPTYNRSASPAHRPGAVVSCIVDEHGNLHPVTPASQTQTSYSYDSNTPSHLPRPHPNGMHGRNTAHGGPVCKPTPTFHLMGQQLGAPVQSPTMRRMRSDIGSPDVFGSTQQIRPMVSMGDMGSHMRVAFNPNNPSTHRTASNPSFNQSVGQPGPASSFNGSLYAESPAALHNQSFGHGADQRTNLDYAQRGHGTPSNGSRASHVSPYGGSGYGDTGSMQSNLDGLTLEQLQERRVRMAHERLLLDKLLSRKEYELDARRTVQHDSPSKATGSRVGGINDWVSSSTLEHRYNSPPSPLGKLPYDNEEDALREANLLANLENLIKTPEAAKRGVHVHSAASSQAYDTATEGGVYLDY